MVREKVEIEERKKRVDDDEDGKYDMSNFLEQKRWRNKANKFQYPRRPMGGMNSSKNTLGSSVSTLKKLPLSSMSSTDNHIDSKTPIKKKNTMNFKKTTNNGFGTEQLDFQKSRKMSVLIGGSKDDSSKRYNGISANGGVQNQINGSNNRIGAGASNAGGTSNSLGKPGGMQLKKRHTMVNMNN